MSPDGQRRLALLKLQVAEVAQFDWRSSRVLAAVIITTLVMLTVLGTVLWIERPSNYFYPTSNVGLRGTTLYSSSQAVFSLFNTGQTDISIIHMKVSKGAGNNATYLSDVSLTVGNVVPAGGTLTLSVEFQNVTWQMGVSYEFVLTDSKGFPHVAYACLNGC